MRDRTQKVVIRVRLSFASLEVEAFLEGDKLVVVGVCDHQGLDVRNDLGFSRAEFNEFTDCEVTGFVWVERVEGHLLLGRALSFANENQIFLEGYFLVVVEIDSLAKLVQCRIGDSFRKNSSEFCPVKGIGMIRIGRGERDLAG